MAVRDPRADQALAILRVVVGIVFMAHGYQKFFVMGVGGVTGFFDSLGVPLPGIAAPAIATLEFVGGAFLVAGLLARPIAFFLMCDVLTALFLVHLGNGFFVPRGIELVMTLAGGALAIALGGAGAVSADRALAARRARGRLS
ncbi:MAG TPA: DoxX family protein [Gemmatimonadales bacterium]|nr:DoxX family protein [Gemmatimonadales bacterium]